jgi:hypothetical protein
METLPTYLLLIVWLLFVPSAAGGGNASLPKDGDYRGLQKMEYNLSPDEKDTEWFHENTLVIRGKEAVLDLVPLSINHGVKSYSASDGGFLTYRGRFFEKDGQYFVQMRLFRSDYVGFKVGTDPYREVKVYPVRYSAGTIEFNGVRYKPAKLKEYKRTDLLKFLGQESVEVERKPQP